MPQENVADLKAFHDYAISPATHGLRTPHRDPPISLALCQFLRAYVRSAYGLRKTKMSYPKLAALLTLLGYATTTNDVKNAIRRKLVSHSVPRTPETERFLAQMTQHFPKFQPEFLFVHPNPSPLCEHPKEPLVQFAQLRLG